MANFCTNCGSKLEDYYNYCMNCGTKIDKSDKKQHDEVQYKKILENEKAIVAKEKEMSSKKIRRNETGRGGYCSLNCKHCYEEILDSGGGIVGDYTDDGMVEYYCALGYSISYGSFCRYYE